MLSLNILPQYVKQEIKTLFVFITLKKLIGLIIISLCFFGVILLAGKLALKLHFIETVERVQVLTSESGEIQNKTNKIQNSIKAMFEIDSDFIAWSEFIEYISANTPRDIRFNLVTIDKNNDTILLSGFSETRKSLISLEKFLQESPRFHNVDFPIQNFLKKQNIDFNIECAIQNYDF